MTKSENAVPSYDFLDGVKFLIPYSAGDLPLICADVAGLSLNGNNKIILALKREKQNTSSQD